MKSIKILLLFLFLGYPLNQLTAQNVVAQNNVEYIEDSSNDLNTIKVPKKAEVVKKKMKSQKQQVEKIVKAQALQKVLKTNKRLRFRSKRHQKPGKCYKDAVCDDDKINLDRNKIK
ncbi:hypothetical protein [Tenacibaculum sp. 190524A05c]|uniref:hypothetical protein n=1 Tax=Tenacibaculum platacis TaxID=3137852 RepID=UPI0032B2B478